MSAGVEREARLALWYVAGAIAGSLAGEVIARKLRVPARAAALLGAVVAMAAVAWLEPD